MSVLMPQEVLISKLIKTKRFWSYDVSNNTAIPDEILIEKTLLYLDIDDINLLFATYPPKKIKQVWLAQIAIQGSYYARLNKLLAWMFFGIKNPEIYLKRVENKHLKMYQ